MAGRWKDDEIAVSAAHQFSVLIEARFDIGDPFAAMHHRRLAGQSAFADTDVIIKFHFQRGAPDIIRKQTSERSAHGGIGQAIGHTAMGGVLRAEMLLSVYIDRHRAFAVRAFDHLQAERAGEIKIGFIGPQQAAP